MNKVLVNNLKDQVQSRLAKAQETQMSGHFYHFGKKLATKTQQFQKKKIAITKIRYYNQFLIQQNNIKVNYNRKNLK